MYIDPQLATVGITNRGAETRHRLPRGEAPMTGVAGAGDERDARFHERSWTQRRSRSSLHRSRRGSGEIMSMLQSDDGEASLPAIKERSCPPTLAESLNTLHDARPALSGTARLFLR